MFAEVLRLGLAPRWTGGEHLSVSSGGSIRYAMHGYAIFDNNVYKGTGRARLERIRAVEKRHGVVALANVVVVQEMLARVRHTDQERRGMNRAAVKKLVAHCSAATGEQVELHFVTHLDGQVNRILTGEDAPGNEEMFANFKELVRVVAESERDAPFTEIAEHLDEIEKHVDRKEREYVSNIEAAAIVVAEPDEMKRNLDYARYLAVRALALHGREIDPEKHITAIIPLKSALSRLPSATA